MEMQIAAESKLVQLLPKRELQLTLVFAFLGTLFDGVELNLISYPMVFISKSLSVTTLAVVTVLTVQGFASLVGGILFGWMADLIGRRRTYGICVIMYGAGALFAGLAYSYGLFMATRILSGFGIGGMFGLAFAMFAEVWKTDKRGFMGGAIQTMFNVGMMLTEAVIFIFLSLFGVQEGWRAGFIALGGVSILLGILALIFLPESPLWKEYRRELKLGNVPREFRISKFPIADLFKGGLANGTTIFMALATATFITSYSTISYMTTFLLKVANVPLGETTLMGLLGLVVASVGFLVCGYISDIIKRKWGYMIASLIGVVGFGSFLLITGSGNHSIGVNFWTSPLFWSIMICNGSAGGFAIMGVWMSEYYPTRLRATGGNTCYYVGRGLGSGLYPLFALDIAGSVTVAFGLGIVGSILGSVLAIFAPDKTGREIKAIE